MKKPTKKKRNYKYSLVFPDKEMKAKKVLGIVKLADGTLIIPGERGEITLAFPKKSWSGFFRKQLKNKHFSIGMTFGPVEVRAIRKGLEKLKRGNRE